MGLTPIPWHAIHYYAQTIGLDDEATSDMIWLVRQMDDAHLKRLGKKAESRPDGKKPVRPRRKA